MSQYSTFLVLVHVASMKMSKVVGRVARLTSHAIPAKDTKSPVQLVQEGMFQKIVWGWSQLRVNLQV